MPSDLSEANFFFRRKKFLRYQKVEMSRNRVGSWQKKDLRVIKLRDMSDRNHAWLFTTRRFVITCDIKVIVHTLGSKLEPLTSDASAFWNLASHFQVKRCDVCISPISPKSFDHAGVS